MTRRKLSPKERAVRQDAHLYPKHFRIIDLYIEKHRPDHLNASDAIREGLELLGRLNLNIELDLDKAVEAEMCYEVFRSEHDGKMPSEIEAEKKAEKIAQDQELDQPRLELEKKVYRFLKREHRDPEDSITIDWFTRAWYTDLKEQGWTGSPADMLRDLAAKGDKEGWT